MSKRLKNYPDPMEVVGTYGADALRVYLINSPVVRGENLRFRESGVKDVLKDVLLPWYHAYRFFVQNVQHYEDFCHKEFALIDRASNVMDSWILSFTNSLLNFVQKEMSEYHLYAVVGPLTKYFDTLTNWYIRLNRLRIRGDAGVEQCELSLSTLGRVLLLIVRLMAPFTPFFCDHLWQNLRHISSSGSESVHFESIPQPRDDLICESLERSVAAMRTVIDLVRFLRERKTIPLKYPLKSLVVVNRSKQFLDDVISLQKYILSEVNVRKLTVSQDKEKYGLHLKATPNFRVLGAKLKGDMKKVINYLKDKVTDEELESFAEKGVLTVLGYDLSHEEVNLSYISNVMNASGEECAAHSDGQANLMSVDKATAYCEVDPPTHHLSDVIISHSEYIENITSTPVVLSALPEATTPIATFSSAVKDATLKLYLVSEKPCAAAPTIMVHYGAEERRILLQAGDMTLTYNRLLYEIRALFSLWSKPKLLLSLEPPPASSFLSSTSSLVELANKTVYVIT
ncbi:unnamed protein product [Gongylonema pulchrum]|uniref:isoleucine--tRNA ligase n=1 Tax=Gongylonema pulchrum TaxID=637853 RepID=A0A183DWX7_9BILA|nr:unnamed protein product [Gongylonema pulchrum]